MHGINQICDWCGWGLQCLLEYR